eukprot:scaffold51880_cov15-Tisochrysis_lutea.AAC.1
MMILACMLELRCSIALFEANAVLSWIGQSTCLLALLEPLPKALASQNASSVWRSPSHGA